MKCPHCHKTIPEKRKSKETYVPQSFLEFSEPRQGFLMHLLRKQGGGWLIKVVHEETKTVVYESVLMDYTGIPYTARSIQQYWNFNGEWDKKVRRRKQKK